MKIQKRNIKKATQKEKALFLEIFGQEHVDEIHGLYKNSLTEDEVLDAMVDGISRVKINGSSLFDGLKECA